MARRTDEIKLPVSLHEDYYDGPLLSLGDANGKGVAQFDADYPDAQKDAQRVVDAFDALLARAEAAESKLARVRELAHGWATDENYQRRTAALNSGDSSPKARDTNEMITWHMQRRAAIDWCGREILAVIEGDRGDGEREV